jgi:hypothetical protein
MNGHARVRLAGVLGRGWIFRVNLLLTTERRRHHAPYTAASLLRVDHAMHQLEQALGDVVDHQDDDIA